MNLVSVAYVSGFTARHVVHSVRCDECNACLTSSVTLSISAFVYCREYKDEEQSVTCPSERLVGTVNSSVTLLEDVMTEVAHTGSVEEKYTAAINNT